MRTKLQSFVASALISSNKERLPKNVIMLHLPKVAFFEDFTIYSPCILLFIVGICGRFWAIYSNMNV